MVLGFEDELRKDSGKRNVKKVLPECWPGSTRRQSRMRQDAMELVCRYGAPSVFVTGTCGPKWTSITSQLETSQTAWDRPDITCRVFERKVREYIKFVKSGAAFPELGKLLYHLLVIEFQHGGLPHFHAAFRFERQPDHPDLVDKLISARYDSKVTPSWKDYYNR